MTRIGVAISGGGYRASGWGLGTLLAVRDACVRQQDTAADGTGARATLAEVASVSGGSITNAWLGLDDRYNFPHHDTAQQLNKIANVTEKHSDSGATRSAVMWASTRAHHRASSGTEWLVRWLYYAVGYGQRPIPAFVGTSAGTARPAFPRPSQPSQFAGSGQPAGTDEPVAVSYALRSRGSPGTGGSALCVRGRPPV